MVSIDYNPLRRSTSAQGTAAQSGILSQRIENTRKSYNLSLEILEEQEEKQREQRVWQAIIGGVQIASGLALTVATGGAAAIPAGGAILGGLTSIASAATGADLSGVQTIIGIGTSTAQQIYGYGQTAAQTDVGQSVNDAINTQIAAGNTTWFVNKDGIVSFAPDTNTKNVLSELDEKYAKSSYFGGSTTPATDKFNEWVRANGATGARQIAGSLVADQTELINNSIQQFKQDGNFQNVLSTIKGLGMTRTQTAEAVNQAAHIAQYDTSLKEAQRLLVEEGPEAAEKYLAGGGDRTIYPAAYGRAGSSKDELSQKEKDYYKARGYTEGSPRDLRMAKKMAAMPEDMAYEAKEAQAALELDLEDSRIQTGLSDTEKDAIRSDLATFDKKMAAQAAARAEAAFAAALEKGGNIGVAAAAAENVGRGDNKSELVEATVEKKILQMKEKMLDDRAFVDFARADTLPELKALEPLYNPESKNPASFSGDYKGLEPLQWQHYRKIQDEINKREKALETASTTQSKEDAATMQNLVNATFRAWERGDPAAADGRVLIPLLYDAYENGLITPADFNTKLAKVVGGKIDDAYIKTALDGLTGFFKLNGTPANTQTELLEAIRQMTLEGKDPKEVAAQIDVFKNVEQAGFLNNAMRQALSSSISEEDAMKVIEAGAAGNLDLYFTNRSTKIASRKGGRIVPETERLIVGDDTAMMDVMEAVKAKTAGVLSELMGMTVVESAVQPAYDRDGDFKGYYIANLVNDTYRLNVEGNKYVVEQQTPDGGWKKITLTKPTLSTGETIGPYGSSNSATSGYNPYTFSSIGPGVK